MSVMSPSQARSLATRIRLSNGITLLIAQNPTVNIVAARLFFPGGARVELPTQAGLSHLVAAVLTKGTQAHSSAEIAEAIESLGASLGSDTSADVFEVSLKCVADDFPQVLSLLAEVVRDPIFPAAEVKREQDLQLQAIRSQQERPFTVAFDHLRQTLYADHPYACPPLGRQETVETLTRQDLIDYHANYCRPDHLVMSVVSPQDPARIQAEIEATLGDWQPLTPDPPVMSPLRIRPLESPHLLKTSQDTQQSLIMIGYMAASVQSEDYIPLKLLTTYLGSGLSSRLFVELREKRGLAYEVSAFYPTRVDPAPFVAYLGTAAENTAIALEGLQAELARLQTDPLTFADWESVKRKLLGQYALGKQTNAQIAQVLGWYEILGLGMEFDQHYLDAVRAVTLEQLDKTIQQTLVNPVVSLVGPENALAEIKA